MVRYLARRRAVVWKYGYQKEVQEVVMFAGHCINTWSTTQGAVALSSAEAEFYAMVDGVMKSQWMLTIARELGYGELKSRMVVGTDSAAAKSFVASSGLGRMRHIEVRDLWLKEEARRGMAAVEKVTGTKTGFNDEVAG